MPETITPKHIDSCSCCCPACAGLECLERPRFFCGQLLTDAELNGEQNYVRAKNRLHNRYLHGWGVVCGLDVVCNDCEGFVTVKQGYAIDPEGEDIVVCRDERFDVLDAIDKLCRARRPRRDDCDPYEPPLPPSCKEVEQHWCITLRYHEIEARPVAPLRKKGECGCNGTSSCGCGCQEQSHSHSRGSSASGSNCGCSTKSERPATTAIACEATRILERYRLCIIPEPPECAVQRKRDPRGDDRRGTNSPFATVLDALPPGSLIHNILTCVSDGFEIIQKGLQPGDLNILVAATLTQPPQGGTTSAQLHAAICRFRQAVIDLYQRSGHNFRCRLLHTLDQIFVRAPELREDFAKYSAAMRETIQHLVGMIVQYFLDCVCQAFLPRCAEDDCRKPLILACVTVRDHKIVNICNFGCRRYAGSFPALYYWLSAVPIVPLISAAIHNFCCGPDLVRANSPLVNDLFAWLDRVDPAGSVRAAVAEGDFALPRAVKTELAAAVKKFTGVKLADFVKPDAVNLPTLVGGRASDADNALKNARIETTKRSVASPDEARSIKNLTMNPLAAPGERVVMYTYKENNVEKVAGFAPAATAEKKKEPASVDQFRALTKEINALKKKVARLEK